MTPEFEHFHPVMSLLSFLLKAPQVHTLSLSLSVSVCLSLSRCGADE
jgi:hypothetical protein